MAGLMPTSTVETITDKYEVIRNIGRKEINYEKMGAKEREQLQTEINVLKALRHPHIVSFYDTVHLADTKTLHLYMEYCSGGDLSKVVRDLVSQRASASEAYVWSILAQLGSALYRCHYGRDPPECPDDIFAPPKEMGLRSKASTTILHRDLKPENIFISDGGSVKLGDFGLSKLICGGDFAHTYVGTPYYMCPELCNGQRYTLKSDVWSVGCILYELCTGKPPFDARTATELASKIRRGVFSPIGSEYSVALRDTITACLQVDPHKRPATNELLDLPTIRLLTKSFELDQKEDEVKKREDLAEQKRAEASQLMLQLQADEEKVEKERKLLENERRSIDDALRREWEVRANLKIDEIVKERIAQETAALHEKWEIEFPKRVAAEVESQMQAFREEQQHVLPTQLKRSTSPDSVPDSSAATSFQSMASDDCTTDLSSLSMSDSPFKSQPTSSRRTSRTPFSRAKAQTAVDSPMDVHMAGQSPTVNRLSLSPRHKAENAGQDKAARNLFAADRARQRWQPTNLSDLNDYDVREDPHDIIRVESEDEFDDLPSPTFTRGNGPFARPERAIKKRPGLSRQQTAPTNHVGAQGAIAAPLLFTKNLSRQDDAEESKTPTSPTRERRAGGGLKIARTDGAMFRDILQREANKRMPGRTLNELHHDQVSGKGQHTIVQQPPVVLAPKNTNIMVGIDRGDGGFGGDKFLVGTAHHARLYGGDVANWENSSPDELPSPFKNKLNRRQNRTPLAGFR